MKKREFTILLALTICLSVGLSAQELEADQSGTEVTIKIYANFLAFNSNYYPTHYQFEREFMQFWGITPAVSFRKKDGLIVHEFEPKFWATTRDDNNIEEYEIGLRYELNWYLKRELFPGFRFRYGPSTRIYYYHADIKRDAMNGFPVVSKNGGIEFSCSIHFEYQISKHLNIEVTFNNFSLNFVVDDVYFDNSALTERQKNQGGFDFEAFGQRILRIGVGYNF